MRAPISWLTEYCDPGLSPEELTERLSMTGTEVERIADHGAPGADGFVVGRVESVDAHPDADRLRVCAVEVGEDAPRTVVCGAPNVAAGQTVAVALPGAVMPDGTELGEAKLRGVKSSGMILSEREMELGDDHSGIAVLDTGDASLEPGTPLQQVVPVSDTVLEVEVTPNRPDCFGVYGVAREVHAITGAELAPAPWEEDADAAGEGEASDYATVEVEVPELCPRFTARVFTEVEIGPSPLWLKQRLAAAGQRPINNVVDITNYVMLLTGQPLHAFDLDEIRGGGLVIRRAAEGETMTTLDGVERTFDSDAVLVCDTEGPSGIAGIMGGQISEVSDGTTRVLLEVATWNGPNILNTSSKLGLRSEASTRFEKQLHPDLTMRAQRIASRLMVELCGAELVPGTIDVDAGLYPPRTVGLRTERIPGLLGMEIPADLSRVYLERLGFGPEGDDGRLEVGIPADRYFDVTREVDLIEEVGRVHGIDEHLEATLPARPAGADERGAGALRRHQRLLRRAEDVLRDAGLEEAITWTFVSPSAAARLGVQPERPIAVHNPLSEEQSVMRTSLLGGLIDAAALNLARGAGRVSLFESARVYLPEPAPTQGGVLDGRFAGDRPPPAREPHRLAAIVCETLATPSWRGEAAAADFYLGKGLVELLCGSLRAPLDLRVAERPFLHPGRSAELLIAGEVAGWLGELHPRLRESADLPAAVAFELDAGPLIAASAEGAEVYEDLTSYPAVWEDIAVVVDANVSAAQVREAIKEGGGELLRSSRIFDVYEGEQVEAGKRSLALRLEFRASDRTLTDEEVAERRARIVAALAGIGGSLRG